MWENRFSSKISSSNALTPETVPSVCLVRRARRIAIGAALVAAMLQCSCEQREVPEDQIERISSGELAVLQEELREMVSHRGYWKFAGVDAFNDGGSVCMSFISDHGELVHLFAVTDLQRQDGKLVYEFARDYRRNAKLPIPEKSDLERAAAWMLDEFQVPEPFRAQTERYASVMKQCLLDRAGKHPFELLSTRKQGQEPVAGGKLANHLIPRWQEHVGGRRKTLKKVYAKPDLIEFDPPGLEDLPQPGGFEIQP